MNCFKMYVLGLLMCFSGFFAQAQDHKISWITFEELEVKMAEEPKPILIDMYTDWCGWCVRMDRKTFGNKSVASYVDSHYYAVKFNAESKESVVFKGRTYVFKPEIGMHELASELMMGNRSFPCIVFMEKDMMSVFPVMGYKRVNEFEPIVRFFAERSGSGQSFNEWYEGFVARWK